MAEPEAKTGRDGAEGSWSAARIIPANIEPVSATVRSQGNPLVEKRCFFMLRMFLSDVKESFEITRAKVSRGILTRADW